MEYRISSRVVSVTTSYRAVERDDRFSIELEFAGARNHSRAWNASCGVLGAEGDWNLDSCSLQEPGLLADSATLHCHCNNPGTFAAFLTTRAEKAVFVTTDQTNFMVILGCGSCLLQSLVSMLVLTAFWWRNRTWLNFLKIQCCAAVIAAMSTFIYAVHTEIPEDNLTMVAMCLEAFLLIGTSSPISQALIIYAELSNVYPSQQLQPTVVAVITGVPILAILTTELTRQTIGWRHESWWLIYDTGVYNIFVTCSITMLVTFLLLYIAVIHKTRPLLYKFTKKDVIQQRIRMLHRSAIVIFGIVAMEVSSIFYVNSASIIYRYLFAFQAALLGFLILAMYVMSGEVLVVAPVLHKFKRQSESDDECASEQTKDRELEKELSSSSSAAPVTGTRTVSCGMYPEVRGVAVGIDARDYVNEAAAGAYVAASRALLPEIHVHHVDDINLENYQQATRQTHLRYEPQPPPPPPVNFATLVEHVEPYKELVSLTSLQEPRRGECPTTTTILCAAQVETCLAMPDVTLAVQQQPQQQQQQQQQQLHQPIATIEAESLLMKKPGVLLVAPDIANTMERKQPDGEDVLRQLELETEDPNDATLSTSGMLDRISHDLDYLLNRTKEDV